MSFNEVCCCKEFKPEAKTSYKDDMGRRKCECPGGMSRKGRIGRDKQDSRVTGQWRERETDTINEEGKIVLAPNERSVAAIAEESPLGLEKNPPTKSKSILSGARKVGGERSLESLELSFK